MEKIKSCSEEKAKYIHRRLQEYNSRYIIDCEDLSYCIENENGECKLWVCLQKEKGFQLSNCKDRRYYRR